MEEARALKRNASQEAEQVVAPKESRKDDDISSMEEDDGDKDEATPTWAKKMSRDMGKILKQMTTVSIKVDDAVTTSKEAKAAVDGLQTEVTDLKNDYITFKAGIGSTVSTTVKEEIEKAMTNLQKGVGSEARDPDGDHPERLVVASGWPMDTPEKIIVDRLREFTIQNSLQEKVVELFCFDDPAMSGVLKFRSEASRNSFLRGSWRMTNKDIGEDRQMKFSKKLTVIERAVEKRLGYIKHAIMTKTGAEKKEVKIWWRRREVEYKHVKVFKVTKEGERVYEGVGKEVKQEVEAKVDEWLKMRMSEDSA